MSTASSRMCSFFKNPSACLSSVLCLNHTATLPELACTCHGKCTFGQGQEVASVACGGEHSLATTSGGEVFAWGWGRYGNLGVGPQEDRHVPTQVQNPLSTSPLFHFSALPRAKARRALCLRAQGLKVRDMSCGAEHSMALAGNGAVYCWGWGAYGNLGDGHREDRCAPVKVGGRAGGLLGGHGSDLPDAFPAIAAPCLGDQKALKTVLSALICRLNHMVPQCPWCLSPSLHEGFNVTVQQNMCCHDHLLSSQLKQLYACHVGCAKAGLN